MPALILKIDCAVEAAGKNGTMCWNPEPSDQLANLAAIHATQRIDAKNTGGHSFHFKVVDSARRQPEGAVLELIGQQHAGMLNFSKGDP